MAYLGMTVSAYSTNFLIAMFGMGWTFLGFGVVCAVLATFSALCQPETKDKTEEEKDAHWSKMVKKRGLSSA